MTTLVLLNRKRQIYTQIDDSDAEWASQFRWHASKQKYGIYARTFLQKTPKYIVGHMHRMLLNAPNDSLVDHKNSDTLDNRRENLRLATPGQNGQNKRGARIDSLTGARGVQQNRSGSFHAYVNVDGKRVSLGTYETLEAASAIAQEARRTLMPYSKEAEVNSPLLSKPAEKAPRATGENNGKSKLTRESVIKIRELRKLGMTYRAIAAEIGQVAPNTVKAVCELRTWVNI